MTFLLMEVSPAGAQRGIRHVLLVMKIHHHKASEAKYVIWVIGDSYLLITIGEGVRPEKFQFMEKGKIVISVKNPKFIL